MKKIFILMGLCIMFAMQSCSSESEPMMAEPNEVNTEISHMVVKFGDKIYETDVKTFGDSVQYLNGDYAEVFDTEISKIKDGATLLYTDENGVSYVEYFHSEKELVDSYEFACIDNTPVETEVPSTRSKVIDLLFGQTRPSSMATAFLYDDKGWTDTVLITYFYMSCHTYAKNLSDLGFNDKTSSIRLINYMDPTAYYITDPTKDNFVEGKTSGYNLRPVLKCYHNKNFSGSVLYCIASPAGSNVNHEDENLKTIGWNDRISSIDWTLVIGFSAFQGDDPEIPAHKDC